jgi:hypothetical protein
MDRPLILLRVIAVLIALRALTNVFKPLGAGSGLVFFGVLLSPGVLNTILAPAVGVFMLVYAYGLWTFQGFALPMGVAYAVYVVVNVLLFPVFQGLPPNFGFAAYAVFGVVAVAVPWLAVWLFVRQARGA